MPQAGEGEKGIAIFMALPMMMTTVEIGRFLSGAAMASPAASDLSP